MTGVKTDVVTRKPLTISILLALGSVIPLVYSAIVSLDSRDGVWFQRSGSLCVLFSVILEIHETRLRRPRPSSTVFSEGVPQLLHHPVPRAHEWFHRAAWIGVVAGTLIWGYGDLLF